MPQLSRFGTLPKPYIESYYMKTNLPKSKAKSRATTYFLNRFNSLRIPSLTVGLLSLPLLAFANMHPGYWTYTVTDLGDFGGSGCEPYAINNSGQVVGRCRFPSNLWHAFLYSKMVTPARRRTSLCFPKAKSIWQAKAAAAAVSAPTRYTVFKLSELR
jgi:probable HAF family extracellular repeat protein